MELCYVVFGLVNSHPKSLIFGLSRYFISAVTETKMLSRALEYGRQYCSTLGSFLIKVV